MHRSGTSATAEVLGQLGLALPATDDLIPATTSNAHGHFEAKSLVRLNERLLASLGGTWSSPPALTPGWEQTGSVDDLRDEAAAAFAATFPRRPAAWKDPRNCILLPFWRTVLGPPTAAVFVYRDPLEVARSLEWRDHLTVTQGLALWERYMRAVSANLDGLPTLCADYHQVLDDPGAWRHQAADFLSQAGLAVTTEALARAPVPIDASLRHQRQSIEDTSGLGDSQRAIVDIVRSLQGAHHPWRAPDLGTEPEWVADVLAMSLDLDTLDREHRRLTNSRAFRLAAAVTKLRRGHP
jgi:hypothetical protein